MIELTSLMKYLLCRPIGCNQSQIANVLGCDISTILSIYMYMYRATHVIMYIYRLVYLYISDVDWFI